VKTQNPQVEYASYIFITQSLLRKSIIGIDISLTL
jgi:hypothetical protein